LVRSQVLRSADGIVRLALNLVPPAADDDAILPQHIAFAASDALALARSARDRGFRPLDIPANYYDDIEARYDIDRGLLDQLKDLNVMYDRDGRTMSRCSPVFIGEATRTPSAPLRSARMTASPPPTEN
jgi:4-hydroxyphenylpyruvate dioxygenase